MQQINIIIHRFDSILRLCHFKYTVQLVLENAVNITYIICRFAEVVIAGLRDTSLQLSRSRIDELLTTFSRRVPASDGFHAEEIHCRV